MSARREPYVTVLPNPVDGVNGAVRLFCTVMIAIAITVALQMRHASAQTQTTPKKSDVLRTFPLSKFYDTPHPLPPGKAGDLIRSETFEEYDLPSEVSAVRILYHSRAASGEDVAASGVVLFPDRKPPAAGWPVIAWAHGLAGVARQCAPSLARNLQHGPFLSMYVNLGYAVVATDYTGLGTNFRNAFADIQSNATDVIYSIPAARAAVPSLDSRWVAMGTAEGGRVAVAVAELENQIHDPSYLGSIAISALNDLQERFEGSWERLPLFLAYGIKTIFPEFEFNQILNDKAVPLYHDAEQACNWAEKGAGVSASELLKPNWEKNQFVGLYFSRNRLGERPAHGPLLVITSESDPVTPISATSQIVARLCKQGDRLQFQTYPDPDPGEVIGDSVRDQMAWIEGRFAGRPASSNCGAQH